MTLFYPSNNNHGPLSTLNNISYNFTLEVTKVIQFYPLAYVMLTCACQHYICQRVKLDHFGYFRLKLYSLLVYGVQWSRMIT